jgi:pimeloyl-ACP methyl ester carboxylesterase
MRPIIYGITALLLAIAAVNLLTTLLLGVRERRRDVAILGAVGATRRQVVGTVVAGGIVLALHGTTWGLFANWSDSGQLIRWADDILAGRPVPPDYREHVEGLLREDRRSEVVEYFFTHVVGVPAEFIGPMQADPSWQTMCGYAHTLPYDAQIAADTLGGKPLPTDRWSISRPVEVVVGENSPAFFHEGAQALVDLLPPSTLRVLPGQDHGAFWAAPAVLADMIVDAVTVARA